MSHVPFEKTSDVDVSTNTNSNLAIKYRPERFEDVYGQEYPVQYLSELSKRKIGRNILLHGTVGSGKTSLVRLFAKALNCREPAVNGSPCGRCDFCRVTDRREAGLYEYNVSGYGDISTIKPWVQELNRTPRDYRYRVLFFDESHRLEDAAVDFLLKAVEEPAEGVLFCFATTESGRIRRALRSRLHDLEVKPLSIPLAIGFLQRFAERERIICEPEALSLLAGLKEGYPRDLLNGLEQVRDPEAGIVTVERVRAVFDVDQTRILVDYFTALAEGDLARQTQLVVSWREPAREKIRWLRAFLTSLYLNDILFMMATVDAVIQSITAAERAPIIRGFCVRLGVAAPVELACSWRAMMDFWKHAGTDPDEAAIMLRIALFHGFVNEELPRLAGKLVGATGRRGPAPATVVIPSAGFPQASDDSGGTARREPRNDADANPAFFRAADAREIINRASFLAQEYGVLFNTAFEVNPSLSGACDEAEGVKLVRDLCAELGQQVGIWNAEGIFAHLTVFERDENGVRALVVAHLPRPVGKGHSIDCVDRAAAWLRHWRRTQRPWQFSAARNLKKGPTRADAALSFHWEKTLELCAGLSERVEDWDSRIGQTVPLRELLKISRPRLPGPILNHPLIHASDNLQPEEIATACANRMEPLSAFDAKAWDWIREGWEQKEFFDRRATKEERKAALAEHQQIHGINTPEAGIALDRLIGSWPSNPEQRRRDWRGGWWRLLEV